jgi:hypothetical protein
MKKERSSTMRQSTGFQHTLPSVIPRRSRRRSVEDRLLRDWRRPTLAEFARQVEHEFGDSVDLSSLALAKMDGDETLSPGTVRTLCDLLGVPPEDFGV